MKSKLFEKFILYNYRYHLAYLVLVLITAFALFYRLGLNPYGIADVEANYILSVFESDLLQNAINLPHKLLTLLSVNLFGASAMSFRLPSVIFGLIFTVSVFSTFNLWHKKRIAIIASLLAVSSSWFLNIARLGTDYIALPTAVMLFVLTVTTLRHAKISLLHAGALLFVTALSLYSPLTIYIVLLFAILYRKEIAIKLRQFKPVEKIISALVFVALLSPLIYTFTQDTNQLKLWLGFEQSLPSVSDFFANLKDVFSYIFWQSNNNILLHVDGLPMLNIFTAAMTALGLYHYEQHHELLRTKFALWGLLVALISAALTGMEEHIIMIWPFILIFAATGVITLLAQWYKIFPLNPVARIFAILPLGLLVMFSVVYELNRFFVAWPNQEGIYEIFNVEGEVLEEAKDNDITIIADDQKQNIINSYFVTRDTKPSYQLNGSDFVFVEDVLSDSVDLSSYVPLYEIYHPVISDRLVFEVYTSQ